MKKSAAKFGVPALDLIDDAVHLLRTVPAGVLLAYYAGAIPFVLGLLFFWSDMSCNAFAERRCPAAALGMTFLFIWLKCWQSIFTSSLRARLSAVEPPKWTWRRLARLALLQGILQPARIFLLPLAFIFAIPFAWVLAFYESVTVLADGEGAGVRALVRRGVGQAMLWPRQNHLLLFLLGLVGLVLWLNALMAVLMVPGLLKTLLGIETTFTRSGNWIMYNTTFLAVTVSLAWLALDPLVKAVYTLRCFHGEARKDGADLIAELAFVRARGKVAGVAALALLLALAPRMANAGGATNPPTATISAAAPVSPAQLDEAVKKTLQDGKYAWRLPREKTVVEDSPVKAWVRGIFTSIGDAVMGVLRWVRDTVRNIYDWLQRHFGPKPRSGNEAETGGFQWAVLLRWVAYALVFFALAALVLLIVRLWRHGWRRRKVVVAEVVLARPNLHDENVTAAQLPEDEWLKLAGEMLDQGDLRLALRAFYLASLAHLASREIVSISRFKSNRDYQNEVNRRARGSPELRGAFAANVNSFDRAWYGLYEVTAEMLAQFRSNFERIRSC